MLNDILNIFRRSVTAFREELHTREPEDQVAELLTSMRREIASAKALVTESEAALVGARSDLIREREALEQCERRERMAAKIGDTETARVAREFATRHRVRIGVLEQKASAAEAELTLRRQEVEQMTLRYKEADANRIVLVTQLRRAAAQSRRPAPTDDQDPLTQWVRIEERVEREVSYVDGLEEIDPSPPQTPRSESDVERRLEEIKRKLGKTS